MLALSFRSRARVAAAHTQRSAPERPARSTIFQPVPSHTVQVLSIVVIRSPAICRPPKRWRPLRLSLPPPVPLAAPSSHFASSSPRRQSTPVRLLLPGPLPPASESHAPASAPPPFAVPIPLPPRAGRADCADRTRRRETPAR